MRLDERGMAHRGHRRDDVLVSVLRCVEVVGEHAGRAEGAAVTTGVVAFVGDAGPASPATAGG